MNPTGVVNDAALPGNASTPPCEAINGIPLDWSGRGTSHVDYDKSEILPLQQGRFLGYGMHGGVYETTCNGQALAWKRKFCRRKISVHDRQEIEIIKKLKHRHIIRLIGTYTHGPFLGLLLWPVATCDLASLLEDVDWLQRKYGSIVSPAENDSEAGADLAEQLSEHQARLATLGLEMNSPMATKAAAVTFLEGTIGCIASAVAYLHASGIKHKDLKPSNILLSADGLWITDFGTATDFSILTSSATENGERGTPKYFAPEMALYAPTGRPADIFSMGCIFLEVLTLCIGYTLGMTQNLRQDNDRSFQGNSDRIEHWFNFEGIHSRNPSDEHLLGLVRQMLSVAPHRRPVASVVKEDVALISALAKARSSITYCTPCCGLSPAQVALPAASKLPAPELFEVTVGNTYSVVEEHIHSYTVFVAPANSVIDMVESLHVFVVSRLLCNYVSAR